MKVGKISNSSASYFTQGNSMRSLEWLSIYLLCCAYGK
jgi:hypothetical protein